MGNGDKKDQLVYLRNKYITELNQLKIKLKRMESSSSFQRKKNVRFNLEIEKMDDQGNISQSPLIQEGGRVDTSTRQCICDLKCTLKGNMWQCRRKNE